MINTCAYRASHRGSLPSNRKALFFPLPHVHAHVWSGLSQILTTQLVSTLSHLTRQIKALKREALKIN